MKTIILALLTLFLISPALSQTKAEDDILSTPSPKVRKPISTYPTSAAFLDATKNGEIPELFRESGNADENTDSLGNVALAILQKEYALNINEIYGGDRKAHCIGVLLQCLTEYEFNHQKRYFNGFRTGQDGIFGVNGKNSLHEGEFPQSRIAFDKFATEYVQALKEYVSAKQKGEQLVEEQKRQEHALVDANAASLKAAKDRKTAALNAAQDREKEIRDKKLEEVLSSPAYKLWRASYLVQQGEELISAAQRSLDHDDAVQQESGVTDLAARRAAGEKMVSGKDLVAHAFEDYRKLGGTAVTPEKVVAGPDPAAQYR